MSDAKPAGESTPTETIGSDLGSVPAPWGEAARREFKAAMAAGRLPVVAHSPEPWDVPDENPFCIGGGPEGTSLGQMSSFHPDVSDAEDAANARRIVACVNACEGINPEAVPELLAFAKDIYEHHDGTFPVGFLKSRLRELIAKAEGGAA